MTGFEKSGFFDYFPEFYKTSKTILTPNRLNKRYLALIDSNKEIIKNSSILDLVSHDGRWSFAALMNGAKNVVGIEGRNYLVNNSLKNMECYGVSKEKYYFTIANVLDEIQNIKPIHLTSYFVSDFLSYNTSHGIVEKNHKIKTKVFYP